MDYEQIVAAVAHAINAHRTRGEDRAAREAVAIVGAIVAADFRQMAQITHQAFHTNQTGTWRECSVASCLRARDAIVAFGQEP